MNILKKILSSKNNETGELDAKSKLANSSNINSETKNRVIENDVEEDNSSGNIIRFNIGQQAKIDAQNSMGNSDSLYIKLNELYNDYKNAQERDKRFQEKQKLSIQVKIDEISLQKRAKETEININNGKIEKLRDENKDALSEIDLASSNPSKLNPPLLNKNILTPLFYIGCFLLTVIGLFLIYFYSIQAVCLLIPAGGDISLDPNKFLDYFESHSGWMKYLIFLIPFVFLALGILIHIFKKQENEKLEEELQNAKNEEDKKNIKDKINNQGISKNILYLFALSFIIDVIIAYLVLQKNHKNSHIGNISIFDALAEFDFWFLIILGFVTYVIWGLIFDWVMDNYEKSNKVKVFVQNKKNLIERNNSKINELLAEINSLNINVNQLESNIMLQRNLLQNPVFNFTNYHQWHGQYLAGWNDGINFLAITKNITTVEQSEKLNQARSTGEKFLLEKKLVESNNINPQI